MKTLVKWLIKKFSVIKSGRWTGGVKVAKPVPENAHMAGEAGNDTLDRRRRGLMTGSAAFVGCAATLSATNAHAGHFGDGTFHLNENNKSTGTTSLVRNSGNNTKNTAALTLFNADPDSDGLNVDGHGSGTGVDAVVTEGNSTSVGVRGRAMQGGTGVVGIAEDREAEQKEEPEHGIGVAGQGPDYGVEGRGGYAGVIGISDRNGVEGSSQKEAGVYGHAYTGVGIVGSSTKGDAGRFYGNVKITGDLILQGNKAAAVPFPDGRLRMLFCQESPEPWFEDFGVAKLVDGRASVELEEGFASVISGNLHVFLTPLGDCRGLYVASTSADSFVVHELGGGNSSIRFSFRVVARRKDQPAERFAYAEAPVAPKDQSIPVRKPYRGRRIAPIA